MRKISPKQWLEIYHKIYYNREYISRIADEYKVSRVAIYDHAEKYKWNSLKHRFLRFFGWMFLGEIK